jgi:hypothetical protein
MNSRTRNSRSELRSLTYDSEGQSDRRRRRTTIDGEMAPERPGSRDPENGRVEGGDREHEMDDDDDDDVELRRRATRWSRRR